jgi:beta-galactosidase
MIEYRDGFGIAVNYGDKPFDVQLKPGDKVLVGDKKLKTADVLVWKLKN